MKRYLEPEASSFSLKDYRLAVTIFCFVLLFVGGCAPPPPAESGEPMGPAQFIIQSVWFFLVAFFVYYMMVLRPSMQKEDAHKKFVSELKKNDPVVTTGGIIGKVSMAKDDVITIEVSPNVRLKVEAKHVHAKSTADEDSEKGKAKE